MSFHDQLLAMVLDSRHSLLAYLPETCLGVALVLLLFIRVFNFGQRINVSWIAWGGAACALGWSLADWHFGSVYVHDRLQGSIFTGLVDYDGITLFLRVLLSLFLFLFIWLTKLTGVPDHEDGPDLYCLVLGATIGLMVMVSANHLLMIFLGLEMASVPSYVLAGLQKGRRRSSEAALKFAVYGAGSAGVMLYGISLLAGVTGTAHLPTMAIQLANMLPTAEGHERFTVLTLAGLMISVGLAFKLSAVPFHFWAPDVFEGATAEVGAFLSVASKTAAIVMLLRLALAVSGEPLLQPVAMHASPAAGPAAIAAAQLSPEQIKTALVALQPARNLVIGLLTLFAILSATWGNLAAYGQTNLKRLLAYSTIAHAGYLIMPVVAAVVLLPTDLAGARQAVAALLLYLTVYLFTNLGAFAAVALVRNQLGSEELPDWAGLVFTAPGVAICVALHMFSLIGLPPVAGFLAKFVVFAALAQAGLWLLLAAGVLNTVVSLFYYLNVVKTLTMLPRPAGAPTVQMSLTGTAAGWYLLLITLPLIGLFVGWEYLAKAAAVAASAVGHGSPL